MIYKIFYLQLLKIKSNYSGRSDFSIIKAGFICEPNVNSISKRLNFLLKNPEKISITGNNAQYYVRKNYTWEKVFLEMNSSLNKLNKLLGYNNLKKLT